MAGNSIVSFWSNKHNGKEPDFLPAVIEAPEAIEEVEETPPPPPDVEVIWRCRQCGSMGISQESMLAHVAPNRRCQPDQVREYIPRPPASESTDLAASGVWIVVKLPEGADEGDHPGEYSYTRNRSWSSEVVEASTGLGAIKEWYSEQVGQLRRDSTEEDREKANGRYVAIDFFTGHRAEALVTSEWRANVTVAKGSHS